MDVRTFAAGPTWVEAVAEALTTALTVKPTLRLGLPTGGTPAPVYAALARSSEVSWREATVFLLDEFGGAPLDDPGRCSATLRRQLLDGIDLPQESFHAIDVDADDLDAVCDGLEAALAPGLDLVVLGLGVNGHVGMNEPGSSPESRTRRVVLAPETVAGAARYFTHDRVPTWGITLGLATILEAAAVWVWATGERKAEIVSRCLRGPPGPDRPASLLAAHPACTWWLDQPAAARLA
jgi:glucosamine-6-phosphate deaminase